MQHRSVRKCDLKAEYLFAHGAVANRAESTGIGGDHPADGGRVAGGEVHADEQSGRRCGALRVRQCDAGTHPDPPCGRVDVADAVQSFGGQQDVVVLGNRAGHQRGAPTLNSDGHARVATTPQHRSDLIGAARPDQGTGPAPVAAGPVGAAAGQHIRIGVDMGAADDGGKPTRQRGTHGRDSIPGSGGVTASAG